MFIEHNQTELYADDDKHKARAFWSSFIITIVVAANPRDVPIPYVPLIYLVWPACMVWVFSPGLFIHAIKTNRFILISVSLLSIYLIFLIYVFSGKFRYESLSGFFEPIMIIMFGTIMAIKYHSHQNVLDGFLSAIAVATLFGFAVMFIGEPFITFQQSIHSYASGDFFSFQSESKSFINEELSLLTTRNAGLSAYIPSFSYQLAAASVMSAVMVLFQPIKIKTILKYGGFLILFLLGIITNAERSAAGAFIIGCIISFWLQSHSGFRFGTRIKWMLLLITIFAGFTLLYMNLSFESIYSIGTRKFEIDDEKYRFLAAMEAVLSAFLTPIGTGALPSEYIEWAMKVGFINQFGNILAPHNHFANFMMYCGWLGVVIIGAIAVRFIRILRWLKEEGADRVGISSIAFAAGAFAAIVNSFAHNHGLFRGEIATCFSFGFIFCLQQLRLSK